VGQYWPAHRLGDGRPEYVAVFGGDVVRAIGAGQAVLRTNVSPAHAQKIG
jgi:hypothetical protein